MKVSGILSTLTGYGRNLNGLGTVGIVAAVVALLSASPASAGTVGTASGPQLGGSGRPTAETELKILTPPEDAETVAIAVVTGKENRWAGIHQPELWKVITMPIGEFVVFSETPNLTHLSQAITAAVVPGGISCATFSSRDCSNRKGNGMHCEFNIDGPNHMMRWQVNSKPECMLCVRNSDFLKDGKYSRFDLETCDVHEDMAQERLKKLGLGGVGEVGEGNSKGGGEQTPLAGGSRVRRQF